MKTKILITVISFVFLTSCVRDEDMPFEGFTFLFSNHTSRNYSEAELFIGGIKNGVFIPTDSILIVPKIKTNGNGYHFIGENRWKPDLRKIRAIPSDRCYFFIKLTNDRESLLGKYNQTEPFSINLPSDNTIGGNMGSVRIYI